LIWQGKQVKTAEIYSGSAATSGAGKTLARFGPMAGLYISQLAEQWLAQHGDEAGEHLAEAIRALREVGDERGAKLLIKVWQHVVQLDGPTCHAPRPVRPVIRRDR